jgi:iron(III) transport system permease protein
VFALILLERWSRRDARYHHTSSVSSPSAARLRGWRAALAVRPSACCRCCFGFLLPAGQLAVWS